MTQLNLLGRLRGITLSVLAPNRAAVGGRFRAPVIDPGRHADILTAVSRLRGDPRADRWDPDSWHIIGSTADGVVVGAIRVRVYDLTDGPVPVTFLLEFANVMIPDPVARCEIERVLSEYIASEQGRCGRFYQIGGFTVVPAYRRTALAPVLSLTVNAWIELLGLYAGCTFATVEENAAALYQRAGAFPLGPDGGLPAFYCAAHLGYGMLLGTEPGRHEPRLAGTISALIEILGGTRVIVPA